MATRKPKVAKEVTEPSIVVGSHLTVTTYPDGKTELKWDDEALLRDVREAINSVESEPKKKSKAKTKS
jgi:hypothetical protein